METAPLFLVATLLVVVAGSVSAALRSKMNEVVADASEITWAHAVNSREALEEALAGPIDFLEADISLGHVEGSEDPRPVPIMAHPPETTSDLSLDSWLGTVVSSRPDKGIKLDFKSIDVVEPSLVILQKYSSMLNSSVWLNADVLPGPIDSTAVPLPAEKFLALCHHYFPEATLSTGWTTQLPPSSGLPDEELWRYGWVHVRRMVDTVRCPRPGMSTPDTTPSPLPYRFTFPVRGIFASRSIHPLRWLLDALPGTTLTVWSGRLDPFSLEDALKIRKSFPKEKVYYDLPDHQESEFRAGKAWEAGTGQDLQWTTVSRAREGENCSALTYAHDRTVVFGKSLTTAVLLKRSVPFRPDSGHFRLSLALEFFGSEPGETGTQELSIVLVDAGLFSSGSTDDDVDLIGSAVRSSTPVHTFRHRYGDLESGCHSFRVELSGKGVRTVECSKAGEREFVEGSGKWPENPFVLVFVSRGDEHVALYDLRVESSSSGGKDDASSTSGSESGKAKWTGLLGLMSTVAASTLGILLL